MGNKQVRTASRHVPAHLKALHLLREVSPRPTAAAWQMGRAPHRMPTPTTQPHQVAQGLNSPGSRLRLSQSEDNNGREWRTAGWGRLPSTASGALTLRLEPPCLPHRSPYRKWVRALGAGPRELRVGAEGALPPLPRGEDGRVRPTELTELEMQPIIRC